MAMNRVWVGYNHTQSDYFTMTQLLSSLFTHEYPYPTYTWFLWLFFFFFPFSYGILNRPTPSTLFMYAVRCFALFWDITGLFSLMLMFPTLLDVVLSSYTCTTLRLLFNKISIDSLPKKKTDQKEKKKLLYSINV